MLGGGFAGLEFCKRFCAPGAHITLVDRQNHHLFQPLLYQVATAGLSAPEIAQPLRSILSKRDDILVTMDEVQRIDLAAGALHLSGLQLRYDYLVLALGVQTDYFGHPEWAQHAPGLKDLGDALHVRSLILSAFERAESSTDPEERRRLMRFVIVGGGPTGVELAGAIIELSTHVLVRDFRRIDPAQVHVVLLEGGPRVLAQFPAELSSSAQRQLHGLGVDVRTNCRVTAISAGTVRTELYAFPAGTILWAAGVSAPPVIRALGVPADRAGRLKVLPDLSLPAHPNVFALGDLIFLTDPKGTPVPAVAQAALQTARHTAALLRAELDHPRAPEARPAFRYKDRGSMATIGRFAAVAERGRLRISGFPAWAAWLAIHLVFLIGLRNKVAVFLQWFYSYATYRRGARIIWHSPSLPTTGSAARESPPARS